MKKVFGLLVAGLLAGPMTANAFLINYQDSPTNNVVKSITDLAVDGKIYDVTFNNYSCTSPVSCEGFDETFAGNVSGAFSALTAIQNALNSAAPAPEFVANYFEGNYNRDSSGFLILIEFISSTNYQSPLGLALSYPATETQWKQGGDWQRTMAGFTQTGVVEVPEPSSLALAGASLAVLGASAARRRRKQ